MRASATPLACLERVFFALFASAFYSNNTETIIVESSLISLCFFTRFSIHKEFEVTCH